MADKTKTIKGATDKELEELVNRLRKESEVQSLIAEIKRKSGSGYIPYDYGQEVSTEKPIESLYHYGVPGMRWGHRSGPRFGITAKRQEVFDRNDLEKLNRGGHLSVGFTKKRQAAYDKRDRAIIEKRIADREDKARKKAEKNSEKEADATQKKDRKMASKNRRSLSDSELKSRIERMQMERKLKDLTDDDISPGKKATQEIISSSGKRIATTMATGAALYAVKVAITKEFNIKEAAGYVAPKPGKK